MAPGIPPDQVGGQPGLRKHRCVVVTCFLLRAPAARAVEEMLCPARPRQPRRGALGKSYPAGDAHRECLTPDAAGEQRIGAEILDGVNARIDARVAPECEMLRAYAQRASGELLRRDRGARRAGDHRAAVPGLERE